MNVIEVFIDKCVEMWENSRIDPYSNERLLNVLEMGAETWWGRGHGVMLVGWSIFGP